MSTTTTTTSPALQPLPGVGVITLEQYRKAIADRATQISFWELSPEEIQQANNETRRNITVEIVSWGLADHIRELGIYEIPDELATEIPAQFAISEKDADNKTRRRRFLGLLNLTNRQLTEDNCLKLSKFMSELRWALNGESIIFDDKGNAASCQHRLFAGFLACLSNPQLRIDYVVVRGVSSKVIDTIDTQTKRSNKEIGSRHSHIMPSDCIGMIEYSPDAECYLIPPPDYQRYDSNGNLLEHVGPINYGANQLAIRTKLIKEYNSACRLMHLRAIRKDVHQSSTDYSKGGPEEFFDWAERFGKQSQDETPCGLEQLVGLVHAFDTNVSKGQKGGVFSEYFGRPLVVAALALHANRSYNPQIVEVEKQSMTGPKTQEKILLPPPNSLVVDLVFASRFLEAANSQSDTGGMMFNQYIRRMAPWLAKGKNADKKLKRKVGSDYKFAVLVRAIEHFQRYAKRNVVETRDPTTGEVVESRVTWGAETAFPMLNEANWYSEGKAHFGGLDIGPPDEKDVPTIEMPVAEPQPNPAINEYPAYVEPTQPADDQLQA